MLDGHKSSTVFQSIARWLCREPGLARVGTNQLQDGSYILKHVDNASGSSWMTTSQPPDMLPRILGERELFPGTSEAEPGGSGDAGPGVRRAVEPRVGPAAEPRVGPAAEMCVSPAVEPGGRKGGRPVVHRAAGLGRSLAGEAGGCEAWGAAGDVQGEHLGGQC